MRKRLLCGVIVVAAAVASVDAIDLGYRPEGLDELEKEKGVFKTTLIHPEADFSRYESIRTRTPALAVRAPASSAADRTTGSLVGGVGGGGYVPEQAALTRFKDIFTDAVTAELQRTTDLEPADTDGPATLVLQPAVTDAVFMTSSRYKSADGEEVPLLSRATVVFDVVDGETGVILARLAERSRCPKPKRSAAGDDGFPPWPNVADWARSAAADLSEQLERMVADPSHAS